MMRERMLLNNSSCELARGFFDYYEYRQMYGRLKMFLDSQNILKVGPGWRSG